MERHRSIKKYFSIAILLGIMVMMVLAFSVKSWQNRNGKLSMVCILKVIDNSDFWTSLQQGAQVAAKEFNVDLTVMGPSSEGAYEVQNEMIREAIEKHPDAILITPSSYTKTAEAAREVVEAGIPLILVDSDMEESLGDTLVATNNFEAGKKLGLLLKDALPENPTIGIVSHVKGASTAMEREQGLREGLKEYSSRILSPVFCNSNYDKAYEVTKQLISEHPEVNAIAGLNEYSAVGAARAVKELGMEDEIVMVGFDSSIEEIQLLEAGVFEGIVIQKPFNMGYLSVQKAVEVYHNSAVESMVDSGSEAVTKENMFTEENQKLLFPFWTS